MISAKATLQHFGFNTESAHRAVQEVRETISNSSDPFGKAIGIIREVTGKDDVMYDDERFAIHIAQYVVSVAVKEDTFDPVLALIAAEETAKKLRTEQSWMFVEAGAYDQTTKVVQTVEKDGITVAVNADGRIKKGSKGQLAEELWKKYMMGEKPLTNKDFCKKLISEAQFTKSGAATYAYNLKKKFSSQGA